MKNRRFQISNEYPLYLGTYNARVKNEYMPRLNSIDFSDPTLKPFEELIKYIAHIHTKPDEVNHALSNLCHYIQQQPPFDYQSIEGKKIKTILNSITSHDEPLKLMDAILYIKRSGLKISDQINFKLSALLRKYSDPITLAKAIITMINFGLLDEDGEKTVANFEKLMPVAKIWFGNPTLAKLFEEIYHSNFTQDDFNRLISLSEIKSETPGNQARVILNIQLYLNQVKTRGVAVVPSAVPQSLTPVSEETTATRQHNNLRLFNANYQLSGNCIYRTIQQDKRDLIKTRSKSEGEQTLVNIDYNQRKSI